MMSLQSPLYAWAMRLTGVALFLLPAVAARAGTWGVDRWGEMLWASKRVPALSGGGLTLLAIAMIAVFFIARRRHARS